VAGTQVLVQALGDAGIAARLWVLTCGAVAAVPGEAVASPGQAQVWGLGRVAALEFPGRWGGLADVPPVLDERAAGRLCAVLAGCGEDQVAVRGSGIWARRLVRAGVPAGPGRRWVPRGSVLITGGTGAIAGHAARWLAGRGCPHVVLTSRSGPAAAGTAGLAAGLAEAGTAVSVAAADAGRREHAAGLLAWAGSTGPVLCGVLHAAGLVQDTPLEEATAAGLEAVLAAKAGGAVHLHELTAGAGLEVFVLFSSIAATWGSGRQPGYAAANAFLDALASARRAAGLPAASLAWGPWDGGGMTTAEGAAYLRRRGLAAMSPELAIQALAQVIDHGEDQVTIADVDWARFIAPFTLRRPAPLLSALAPVPSPSAAGPGDLAGAGDGNALAQRLAGLPAAEQDRVLLDLVRAEAAAVLGHSSPEAVEPGRAFSDLGFDSLTAVELRNRLSQSTGLPLPATLLFDYPSQAALAGHLRNRLFPATENSDADVNEEAGIRRALAAVPLAQFRAAGVMDVLLKLANLHSGAEPEASAVSTRIDSIAGMDAEGLIQMALGDDGSR
jgi:short-subunit dehydrogenase/acyl carrier protein